MTSASVNSRCTCTSYNQLIAYEVCLLSRKFEVWLCRFRFILRLARNRPSKVAIAASSSVLPLFFRYRSFFLCSSAIAASSSVLPLFFLCCCCCCYCDLCFRSRGYLVASYDSSYTAARAASALLPQLQQLRSCLLQCAAHFSNYVPRSVVCTSAASSCELHRWSGKVKVSSHSFGSCWS